MTDSNILFGISASPGLGIAGVVRVKPLDLELSDQDGHDPEKELKRFEDAQGIVRIQIEKLKRKVADRHDEWTLKIFDSHLFLIKDPELQKSVADALRGDGVTAEYALLRVRNAFVVMLEGIDSDIMRERSSDLIDVTNRIIAVLTHQQPVNLADLDRPVILAAHDLSPLETSQLQPAFVKGIVTEVGSFTCHTAIMARSLGIPAVTGLRSEVGLLEEGQIVILDGSEGSINIRPDPQELEQARKRLDDLQKEKERLSTFIGKKTVSANGVVINIGSHLNRPEDLEQAEAFGAEGIGLFRTEFLFMENDHFPEEEVQFAAYKTVVEHMNPRSVIIRTIDIGGDKNLSHGDRPAEENPFLGLRGIRYSLSQVEIFRVQLRALLRTAAFGNLKIMFPMVSTVEEILAARELLAEEEANLKKEGNPVPNTYDVGVMIEVPSAALIAEELAQHVDFFSIGTNDLIQYTMAADRGNDTVSHLYQPLHPAILRLIRMVTEAAHNNGIWTGVCGDMAGDLNIIPILLDLGVTELSVSAPQIPAARELISRLDILSPHYSR